MFSFRRKRHPSSRHGSQLLVEGLEEKILLSQVVGAYVESISSFRDDAGWGDSGDKLSWSGSTQVENGPSSASGSLTFSTNEILANNTRYGSIDITFSGTLTGTDNLEFDASCYATVHDDIDFERVGGTTLSYSCTSTSIPPDFRVCQVYTANIDDPSTDIFASSSGTIGDFHSNVCRLEFQAMIRTMDAQSFGFSISLHIEWETDLQLYPDIAITPDTLEWTQDKGVCFDYEVMDIMPLPERTTIALYWSEDDTFDPGDTPIPDSIRNSETAIGDYSVQIPLADLSEAPVKAEYLLAVVDPEDKIVEYDESNNTQPLRRPSLVFRDLKYYTFLGAEFGDFIPGIDHVGFQVNGLIYESHPGYEPGRYWDSIRSESVPVLYYKGVQQEHTLGSFISNYNLDDPSGYGVEKIAEVFLPVPEAWDA